MGNVVAAQADREAEQGAEYRACGRTASRCCCRRSLVGEVLAIGDVILVAAATDAGVDQRAILRRGAAAAKQGGAERGGKDRFHRVFQQL